QDDLMTLLVPVGQAGGKRERWTRIRHPPRRQVASAVVIAIEAPAPVLATEQQLEACAIDVHAHVSGTIGTGSSRGAGPAGADPDLLDNVRNRKTGGGFDTDRDPNPLVKGSAHNELSRYEPAWIEVAAQGIEKQPIGARCVGLARIKLRDRHDCDDAGRGAG